MRLLITGANGYIAGKTIKNLLRQPDTRVLAAVRHPEKMKDMYLREDISAEERQRVDVISYEELLSTERPADIQGVLHLAFARRNRSYSEIADSIRFSAEIFSYLKKHRIGHAVYCSTQGVYGNTEALRTEDTVPSPETAYTMAKYAAEELFRVILRDEPDKTIIRLDSVAQSQNLLQALCRQAIRGDGINLRGGGQQFSYIDGEDAGSGLAALFRMEGVWKPIFNLGQDSVRSTLTELAELVADEAERQGYPRPEIHLDKQEIRQFAGMNSKLYMSESGWKPLYGIKEIVSRIFAETCAEMKDNGSK